MVAAPGRIAIGQLERLVETGWFLARGAPSLLGIGDPGLRNSAVTV